MSDIITPIMTSVDSDDVIVPVQRRKIDYSRVEAARNKRKLQLEAWELYDNNMQFSRKSNNDGNNATQRNVVFLPNFILLEAVLRDDYDEVQDLLDQGMDPNVAKDDGLTPLHQACINDSLEMCELLIEHGADINCLDSDMWTPLHAAASSGHLEICELLVTNGANILALNIDGNIPLDLAEYEEIRDYLVDAQYNKNISDEQLFAEKYRPEKQMYEELMEMYNNKEPIDQLDLQGAAPIHVAAANGYMDVITLLFRMNADMNALDADRWTPAHVAAYWSQLNVLKLLVSYGADFTLLTPDDQTVFGLCDCQKLHTEVLQIWDERDTYRSNTGALRYKSLPRRRSTSSVHRSSRRDKSNISKQEVMKEVAFGELNKISIENGNLEEVHPKEPDDYSQSAEISQDFPDELEPSGESLENLPGFHGDQWVDKRDPPTNNMDPSSPRLRSNVNRSRTPTGYEFFTDNAENEVSTGSPEPVIKIIHETPHKPTTIDTDPSPPSPQIKPSPPPSPTEPVIRNQPEDDDIPTISPFKRSRNLSVTDSRQSLKNRNPQNPAMGLYDPDSRPKTDYHPDMYNGKENVLQAFLAACCRCC